MIPKQIIMGVSNTVNPNKGKGVVESIVILIIVVSVIAMNMVGIDIDPIVASAFGLVAGYLFGNNTKDDNDEEEDAA